MRKRWTLHKLLCIGRPRLLENLYSMHEVDLHDEAFTVDGLVVQLFSMRMPLARWLLILSLLTQRSPLMRCSAHATALAALLRVSLSSRLGGPLPDC